MFLIIGFIVVLGAVLGGYVMEGGQIGVLLHPLPAEGTIIFGAGLGPLLASNPPPVIKALIAQISKPLKGSKYPQPG